MFASAIDWARMQGSVRATHQRNSLSERVPEEPAGSTECALSLCLQRVQEHNNAVFSRAPSSMGDGTRPNSRGSDATPSVRARSGPLPASGDPVSPVSPGTPATPAGPEVPEYWRDLRVTAMPEPEWNPDRLLESNIMTLDFLGLPVEYDSTCVPIQLLLLDAPWD